MRQLIDTIDNNIAFALNDRAFTAAIDDADSLLELRPASEPEDKKLLEVTAISITIIDKECYVAVSRCDKTLSIYKIDSKSSELSINLHCPKRVSCLRFATLGDLDLIVSADLTGDVYAYDIKTGKQRLLLGHTASMLTGMKLLDGKILTADRDEKVRISSFPDTHVIQGFLLGHEAFVSALSICENLCVTCGGDASVRLWDLTNYRELANYTWSGEDEKPVYPTKVLFNNQGNRICVIFDQCSRVEAFNVEAKGDEYKIAPATKTDLDGCYPLDMSLTDSGLIALLHTYSSKLSFYDFNLVPQQISELPTKIKEIDVEMPDSILERDEFGKLNLLKINETRDSSVNPPWNNPERVEVHKERNKRMKRRKLERQKAAKTET